MIAHRLFAEFAAGHGQYGERLRQQVLHSEVVEGRKTSRCVRSPLAPNRDEDAGRAGARAAGHATWLLHARRNPFAWRRGSCQRRWRPCRERKRAKSAAVSTFAGTACSTAASTVQRPSPESSTRPVKEASCGSAGKRRRGQVQRPARGDDDCRAARLRRYPRRRDRFLSGLRPSSPACRRISKPA